LLFDKISCCELYGERERERRALCGVVKWSLLDIIWIILDSKQGEQFDVPHIISNPFKGERYQLCRSGAAPVSLPFLGRTLYTEHQS